MKHSHFSWAIGLSLLLATAAAWPFATKAGRQRDFYLFEVELTSTSAGRTQLFFDVGKAFNESDSSIQPLEVVIKPTRYRYMLPSETIRGLRLDPIDRDGAITLAHARVLDFTGHIIREFQPGDFQPLNQIAEVKVEAATLRIRTTEKADDPSLLLRLNSPLKLTLNPLLQFRSVATLWWEIFLPLLLLMTFFPEKLLSRGAGQLSRWARRPLATLGAVAAVAVLLQCYPVIFFGKSFVSPNNGSPFYYETFPTLPGYHESYVENVRGSDVAAMFHQSLFYPSIQHEALFRFHELPLWNRFAMCGVPHLGQGQSMFGGILNLTTILGNSSAGSWDLRFLLARWLFGWGLGYAAWLLTRSLKSASLVSFCGIFVGFFSFRINHMAQFSVEASPWILVGWLLLIEAVEGNARAYALLILGVANWEVLQSGTVKEAYILLAAMNAVGFLMLITSPYPPAYRVKRAVNAACAGIVVLLIAAPILLCIYRALATSYTVSDHVGIPSAAPAWQFVGLFEDIFDARLTEHEWWVRPSTNFVILIGLSWSLVYGRIVFQSRAASVLAVAIVGCLSLIFGFIPATLLIHVPVLRNLHHIDNVFSCVLVVIAPLLASYGIRETITEASLRSWWKSAGLAVLLVGAPISWYFAKTSGLTSSMFFSGYAPSLLLGILAVHLAFGGWRQSGSQRILWIGGGGALFVLLWAHGQYLTSPFDEYVFNPQIRVDLRAPSEAARIVSRNMAGEPERPAGLGVNLFCGYNEMLGWESIYGVDAVRNRNYDTLLAQGGISKLFWPIPDTLRELGGDPSSWHEDHLDALIPLQNLLNVRTYLATPVSLPQSSLLKLTAKADLAVYRSDGAWPRAFFTNSVWTYQDVRALLNHLQTPGGRSPFAAVEKGERLPTSRFPEESDRKINTARDYVFTTNTTTFTVDATGPGAAVLTENFYAKDFEVTVNDKPTKYFRVNHTFKGVWLPSSGTYRIAYRYWPEHLTAALYLSVAGLLMGIISLLRMWRNSSFPKASADWEKT